MSNPRSSPTAHPQVTINRSLVGQIAVCCLLGSILMMFFPAESNLLMWRGALFRVGVVMAAFWMALPTKGREAAWARVPIWQVAVAALLLVGIARSPSLARWLVPAVLITGIWLLFKKRGQVRSPRDLFR